MAERNKKIMIVGAGFAGLRCVKRLTDYYPSQVILLDQNDYHMYWPLLCRLDLKEASLPIETKAKFTQKKINDYHELDYDYLVLATGAGLTYCGIEGLEENAVVLRSLKDIERILALPKDDLVIVGGGVTGVELAAELVCKYGYKGITIIEGCSDILPNLKDKRISQKARKRLEKLGVKILTDHFLSKVEKNKLTFNNGEEIKYQGLIWAGGVRLGQYKVDSYLKVEGENNVFAIGDCASLDPGMVEPALQQAKVAAENIRNSIEGKNLIEYKPRFLGIVIPLGGHYAVGKIGNLVVTGWSAWLAKELIHFYYKKTYV